MRFKTVKKVAIAGLLLSLALCFIGIFGMDPSSEQAGSMAIWAIVVLLFTICLLYTSRCV